MPVLFAKLEIYLRKSLTYALPVIALLSVKIARAENTLLLVDSKFQNGLTERNLKSIQAKCAMNDGRRHFTIEAFATEEPANGLVFKTQYSKKSGGVITIANTVRGGGQIQFMTRRSRGKNEREIYAAFVADDGKYYSTSSMVIVDASDWTYPIKIVKAPGVFLIESKFTNVTFNSAKNEDDDEPFTGANCKWRISLK